MATAQTRLTPDGPVNPEQQQSANDVPTVFHLSIASAAAAPDPPLVSTACICRSTSASRGIRCRGGIARFWDSVDFKPEYLDTFNENYDAWINGPVSGMPVEDVRAFMSQLQKITDEAHDAASQRETNWELDLEELSGPETVQFMLSDFQEFRQLSRLLILDARVAIADGRFDDAIHDLQTNYRLAQDVQEPQLIINSLIGIAITTMGHQTVTQLIDAPNSPNMYWALATLPRPLHNMEEAMSYEVRICSRIFPWLDNVENIRSNEEWRMQFRESLRSLEQVSVSA